MVDDPTIPMLQGFEGFRSEPYWDVNHYRAGFGSDTVTKPDGSVVEVQPGMTVTPEDAQRDLTRRAAASQASIESSIGPDAWAKLSPAAKASLTSVHYNYGHLPYGVQTAAASGDPGKIAAAIGGLAGDNNGVNADRRAKEAANVLGTTPAAPSTTTAAAPSSSPSVALLQALIKGKVGVAGYTPNSPGGTLPQSRLEAILRTAGGQGTYKPAIVSKLEGLGGALSSLFGGSTTGPGSPPGPAAQQLASASPVTAAPLPAAGPASPGEGGTSLIEGRSAAGGSTGPGADPNRGDTDVGTGSTGPAGNGIFSGFSQSGAGPETSDPTGMGSVTPGGNAPDLANLLRSLLGG